MQYKGGRPRARFPEDECKDERFWTDMVFTAVTLVIQIQYKGEGQRARFPEDECNDERFWTEIVVTVATLIIQLQYKTNTNIAATGADFHPRGGRELFRKLRGEFEIKKPENAIMNNIEKRNS